MTAASAPPPADDRLGERPRLAPHVRLHRDVRRERWVLQAPERILVLDEIAHEIILRCDGRSIAAIAGDLALVFDAAEDEIARDVLALIDDLGARGLLVR